MAESAQRVLEKTLSLLLAKKARTEKEIAAVRSALAVIGAPSSEQNVTQRRLRKPMTAAERKSVSKRMKAYWARKRKMKGPSRGQVVSRA